MFAGLAFAGVASAAAVPATAGFVGVFSFVRHYLGNMAISTVTAAAILVTGCSVVWAYRRVLGGGFHHEVWTRERWPRKRQVAILFLLALAIVLAGLFPKLVTSGYDSQGDVAVSRSESRATGANS